MINSHEKDISLIPNQGSGFLVMAIFPLQICQVPGDECYLLMLGSKCFFSDYEGVF